MGLLDSFLDLAVEEVTKQLAENLIPDFSNIDVSNLPERSKGLIEKAKEDRKDQIEQMVNGTKDKVDTNFKKLNTNVNLLFNCAMQLTPRMVGYITDMIGTCAVGPTVNINKIPTIIGQLKNDSEILGKAYDDTETSLKEALMGLDPSQLGGNVGNLVNIITGTLSTVAPLLAMFGISRGGLEPDEDGPDIESPIEAPELLPSDCQNYTPDSDHTSTEPKECKYCTRFVHATPEKSIYEFQDDPEKGTAQEQYDEWYEAWAAENRDSFTCNNCKFFKK